MNMTAHIAGYIDNDGHGGWGVTIYRDGEKQELEYSGHILTSEKITAEKMALIIALAIFNKESKNQIVTENSQICVCFHKPDLSDVFDDEIALLKEKCAVKLFWLPPWAVDDARESAKQACIKGRSR